jgi:cytochrome c oxidase subunit 2
VLTRHRYRLPFLGIIIGLFTTAPAFAQEPAEQGRVLFEQLCVACHSIGGGDRVGPDLAGVTQRRDEAWLKRMMREPQKLIAEGDPVVTALVKRYNGVVMPYLGLDDTKASAIIAHLQAFNIGAAAPTPPAVVYDAPELMQPQARILHMFLLIAAVIVLVFGMVAVSTRSPRDVSTAKAYALRRVLFLIALTAAIGVLVSTLPKTPYAAQAATTTNGVDRIVYVTARQFEFIWSNEPIASAEDIGRVQRLDQLVIDAGSTVEFRVTSVDVNHGFGLYGPERQIVAQTQAMPGYINRLRVRLDAPGEYPVLCLEYCAAGHHRMRSQLIVR